MVTTWLDSLSIQLYVSILCDYITYAAYYEGQKRKPHCKRILTVWVNGKNATLIWRLSVFLDLCDHHWAMCECASLSKCEGSIIGTAKDKLEWFQPLVVIRSLVMAGITTGMSVFLIFMIINVSSVNSFYDLVKQNRCNICLGLVSQFSSCQKTDKKKHNTKSQSVQLSVHFPSFKPDIEQTAFVLQMTLHRFVFQFEVTSMTERTFDVLPN